MAGSEDDDLDSRIEEAIGEDEERDEEQEALNAAATEAEEKARKLGWAPRDEWRGAESDWLPAEQFLTRIAMSRAALDERFEAFETRHKAEIGEVNKRLDETTRVLGEMHENSKLIVKRFKDSDAGARERMRQRLDAEMEAAVDESDKERFRSLKAQREALDEEERKTEPEPAKPAAEQEKPAAGQPNPVVTAWVDRNEWFKNGKQWVRDAATAAHRRIIDAEPDIGLQAGLDKVTEEMRLRYPEEFENQRRTAAPTTVKGNGGNPGGGRKKKAFPEQYRKDYESLKKTFKARGVDYTEAEYIEDYHDTYAGADAA